MLAMKPITMMVLGPPSIVHMAMKPITVKAIKLVTITETILTMVAAIMVMEVATTATFKTGCPLHLGFHRVVTLTLGADLALHHHHHHHHHHHQAGYLVNPKSKCSLHQFLNLRPKPLNHHASDSERLLKDPILI